MVILSVFKETKALIEKEATLQPGHNALLVGLKAANSKSNHCRKGQSGVHNVNAPAEIDFIL